MLGRIVTIASMVVWVRGKYWEIIADNLHDAGWSLRWVSALDLEGRMIWIVGAHHDGKRFIVRAEEILTAFLEAERAIHQVAVSYCPNTFTTL